MRRAIGQDEQRVRAGSNCDAAVSAKASHLERNAQTSSMLDPWV